ncbi:MAG: ferritin-like domain-containing protein [Campylobacterota bacterium]
MQFYSTLEKILTQKDLGRKFALFEQLYGAYKAHSCSFASTPKKVFTTPSYAGRCQIVDAAEVPKRAGLHTDYGKAVLLHAIAHIEFSAIDLALDACYRFEDMPIEFYDDWLEVAQDEIRHFMMIENLLQDIGYHYGSFVVHSFLFDVSQRTLSLLERMAVVPRYLEAAGLDSNPKIIEKLRAQKDAFSPAIVQALEIILEEEVDHVKKGDRWFAYACKRAKVSKDSYYDIVEKILPGAKKKKGFVNIKDRRKAGFSCEEINVISKDECRG